MRIDSAGIPLPDDPSQQRDAAWFCLMCHGPCWPTVDRHGHVVANLCQPCTVIVDDAKAEHARTREATP